MLAIYEMPSNQMQVHCEIHASNPLVLLAPDIDSEYVIDLSFETDHVHYVINGCHDAFPNHELYLNGAPLVDVADDGDPLSLIPNCGVAMAELAGDIQ